MSSRRVFFSMLGADKENMKIRMKRITTLWAPDLRCFCGQSCRHLVVCCCGWGLTTAMARGSSQHIWHRIEFDFKNKHVGTICLTLFLLFHAHVFWEFPRSSKFEPMWMWCFTFLSQPLQRLPQPWSPMRHAVKAVRPTTTNNSSTAQ